MTDPYEDWPANDTVFDLALFQSLNKEYESKPLRPTAPSYTPDALSERGSKRAKLLTTLAGCQGKRVLEIGCGRGETARAFATEHGCYAVGADIREYEEWNTDCRNVQLVKTDLTGASSRNSDLEPFDFIYSFSVWEHLRHPFAMLQRVRDLLNPGGTFFLKANLFRGPIASHRYREIYFPWPHLLFQDNIFEEYYRSIGMAPKRPAWINRLSIGDYYNYFRILGFEAVKISFSKTPMDEGFYNRFRDILERYPRFDLECDFLNAHLRIPAAL